MCSHIPAKFPLWGDFFFFFVLDKTQRSQQETQKDEKQQVRGGKWEETQHQVDEGKIKHSEKCDSWEEVKYHQFKL